MVVIRSVRGGDLLTFVFSVCWFAGTHASAAPLPLINPGFEDVSVTLAPGEMTSGTGGGTQAVHTFWPSTFADVAGTPRTGVFVQGWRSQVVPPQLGDLNAGVINPGATINGQAWLTGYSGRNVAIAQNDRLQQTLNVQLQPRTVYTVRFLAGIGRSDLPYFPIVSLLGAPDLATPVYDVGLNVPLLASLENSPIGDDDLGVMRPYSFSYTTPNVLPPSLQGRYLALALVGSDGFPRVAFDDFSIDAVPVPGPWSGAVALLTAGSLARRRRPGMYRPGTH